MVNIFTSVISKMNSFFGGLEETLEIFEIGLDYYGDLDRPKIIDYQAKERGIYQLKYGRYKRDEIILEEGEKIGIYVFGTQSMFII